MVAFVFNKCRSDKRDTKKNSTYDTISFSYKDISEKRWCFGTYIFYLRNDQTCFVTRLEDESLDWGSARWALKQDTLMIIEKDDKLLYDTALYKDRPYKKQANC